MLVYALICELYTFLFTFVMTSVSVGVLLALRSGSLSETDLGLRFNSAAMVDARLARLVANGYLAEDHGNYLLPRGNRLLWVFRRLRSLIRHDQQTETSHSRSAESAPGI